MKIDALLFGSIGVLADTHDMQRRAFNAAFAEAGLDWDWAPEAYRRMVQSSGGQARIAAYAKKAGAEVDAAALHAAKVAAFARMMAEEGLSLRPGVRALMDAARREDIPVAFVTGTGKAQSDALLEALAGQVDRREFAFIGDASMVEQGKPDPAIYKVALKALVCAPQNVLAIEDTPVCAEAALAAGIPTIGFPGEAARGMAFPRGCPVVRALSVKLIEGQSLAA